MINITGVYDGNYYVNGAITGIGGVVKVGDDYYLIAGTGKVLTNVDKYLGEELTKGVIPVGPYKFGEDGKLERFTGIKNGYYYVDGIIGANAGLIQLDGDYYFITKSGLVAKNQKRTITEETANGFVDPGIYTFDAEGKMVILNGIHNGYYYEDNAVKGIGGVVKIGDDYYLIAASGKVLTNVEKHLGEELTKGVIPVGPYKFGDDGKMVIFEGVNENGYYYVDGMVTGVNGLVEENGNYYFITKSGLVAKNQKRTITEETANGFVNPGRYTFDAEGKMVILNGIHNGYYYEDNAVKGIGGVAKIDDDYYLIAASGKVLTNVEKYLGEELTKGLIPVGIYKFGEDGKMVIFEGVNENGYYYVDGMVTGVNGLVEENGNYYFITKSGLVAKNQKRTITEETANGFVNPGRYTFGEDGKMII